MTPEARKDQMLAQEVGDEVVVYDERTHQAHRLNHTAALVWRLANGQRSVGELASQLHETIDVPEDEEFVRLALAELDQAGLLIERLPGASELLSRRDLFKVAAYLLPVVASIVAPTPAMAAITPLGSSSSSVTALLTVTKQGNGTGTVTSSPAGIDCGSSCSRSFLVASPVTLMATAGPGSVFSGWSGGCNPTGNSCGLFLAGNVTIIATFTLAGLTVSFRDETFNTSDWEVASAVNTGPYNHVVTQQTDGGNPGPFRRMDHIHNGNGTLLVRHRYRPGVYMTGGVIDSIDYQEDRKQLMTGRHDQDPNEPIESQFLLFQGNQTYAVDLPSFSSRSNWETTSRSGLRSTDFAAIDGTAGRPDFNNPNGMMFGYARRTTARSLGMYDVESWDHGIDNWTVTVRYHR